MYDVLYMNTNVRNELQHFVVGDRGVVNRDCNKSSAITNAIAYITEPLRRRTKGFLQTI